jgi:DnaJ-class molecular chaperone
MTTQAPYPPEGYAYETCGLCNGLGKGALGPEEPCPPCNATGQVLVNQPPIKCLRCGGNGRAKQPFGGLSYALELCRICRGAGWVMALVP